MTCLLYSLHSGNLYGTERMALATSIGLSDEYETVFIAPEGPVHAEAQRLGFRTMKFETPRKFVADIRPFFAREKKVVSIGTRVLHTLGTELWARVYGSDHANIQVVHGGADERLSYARKRWLNRLGVKQVAVSEFVKERMIAYGADVQSIAVIENFLTPERVDDAPRRPAFTTPGIRKVVVISRLDPIKRIDLLLDALDATPELRGIEFEIYGSGSEEETLKSRALANNPNVHFLGYRPDIPERMSRADLLLHLCPEEPFGLAILEGMAAGIAVLVPNSGGAGAIVEDGRNGFRFQANDAADLARKLIGIQQASGAQLQAVVAGGMESLQTRYSAEHGVAEYRKLIQSCLN